MTPVIGWIKIGSASHRLIFAVNKKSDICIVRILSRCLEMSLF